MDQEDTVKVSEITEGTIFTGTFMDSKNGECVDSLFIKGKGDGVVMDIRERMSICNLTKDTAIEDYSVCEKRGVKIEEIVHDLTDDELIQRGQEISECEIKAHNFREDEKYHKSKAKEAKEDAEIQEKKRYELGRVLEVRREKRETECPQYFCYKTEKVFILNPIDNRHIFTRDINRNEKDVPLFKDGEIEENEAPSKESEVMESEEPSDLGQKIQTAQTDSYIKNYNTARDLIESEECSTLEDLAGVLDVDGNTLGKIWSDLIGSGVVEDDDPVEVESEVDESVAQEAPAEEVEAEVVETEEGVEI